MHCAWEIIDNAVDEALAGFCRHIVITVRADGSVEVADDGRGIPVDIEPKTGLTGVEVVFTKLHAGGKFGGSPYGAAGGLHGVGASVVNALAQRLDVEVDRGGRTYHMSFHRGEPGRFADADPAAPSPQATFEAFTDHSELDVIGRTGRKVTGTRVRYWADPQIFPASAAFSVDDLLERARQTSFLVPGLEIIVRDERSETAPEEREHRFCHTGGVSDYVEYLAPDEGLHRVWRLTGSGTFTETVQVLDSQGHLAPQQVERTLEVEVALRWGTGYDTAVKSFVNIIATPKGGTHVQGFEQGLLRAVREQVTANSRKLKISAKEGGTKIEKDDVLAGLTAVLTVRLAEPQFEGQTKEVLGTGPVRGIVAGVVREELTKHLTAGTREGKAAAALILDKVVGEMRARVAARTHKEISRRKNALETSSLPSKLADCRTNDVERSELFIVEGDSALGTAKLARHSDFQALLPIRGKILNVQKASTSDMLSNAECASIIQVIGAGSGRTFDIEQLRYGKIIIMTDADVDGAHIRTLLLTLFFRYMRPLIAAGRVYAAVPPLHRVAVTGPGRADKQVVYTYSEGELGTLLRRLDSRGKRYTQPVQRYKGLGEMDADQLAETTMDPRHRTLRRIGMRDAAAAERIFEMLMGNDVAPRKDFIVAGAAGVDRAAIDA
jgi:DNA gyrase subunit B